MYKVFLSRKCFTRYIPVRLARDIVLTGRKEDFTSAREQSGTKPNCAELKQYDSVERYSGFFILRNAT